MQTKAMEQNKLDIIKWLLVLLLLASGVWANYHFIEQPLYLRLLGGLIVVALSVAFASQTARGKLIWNAITDARSELRKVVWSTKKETIQTTSIVIFVVILVSIFLWMLDSALAKLASWLIN